LLSPLHWIFIAFAEAQGLVGLSAADYDKRLTSILNRARNARPWAAGTLFRLTGQDRFNQAVVQRFAAGWVDLQFMRADGAWEYANATHAKADVALKRTIRKRNRCRP
jgi:hypothetical protein